MYPFNCFYYSFSGAFWTCVFSLFSNFNDDKMALVKFSLLTKNSTFNAKSGAHSITDNKNNKKSIQQE